MSLPVSMDDKELFPKVDILNLTFSLKSEVNEDVFKQMFSSLNRLWWSRLVISVRGYVINYVQQNDEVLFNCDDAFIKIHQKLAERNSHIGDAFEYLRAIFLIIREKNTLIQMISNPRITTTAKIAPSLDHSFNIVHGEFSPKTIQMTIAQLPAYTMFIKVFVNLQQRWENEKLKKKSIRFETDPEWEPDERVVLFQTFASDNRTWVLLDFDRYILQQWKPNGTSVIFGDRFVEKKKRAGLKLCSTCGMLEQKKAQFAVMNDQAYCSKTCFDEENSPMTVNDRGATVVHI